MMTFLENTTRSGGWSGLPPYVPLLIQSAQNLAVTGVNSWQMLCGEIGCHRAVFKFCCTSPGTFDSNLYQSYCNRLRLIHNSLNCGILVALRALLDQLRVWLQIGATVTNTGHSFMPDHKPYFEELGQLVTTLQRLEQNAAAVRFPNAAALSHDASLMREVHAQYCGGDSRLTSQGSILDDDPFVDAPQVSSIINTANMPESAVPHDQSSSTAQDLLQSLTEHSFAQGGTPTAEPAAPSNGGLLDDARPFEVADWSEPRGQGDDDMVDLAFPETPRA